MHVHPATGGHARIALAPQYPAGLREWRDLCVCVENEAYMLQFAENYLLAYPWCC
jgi:hypothetical protein